MVYFVYRYTHIQKILKDKKELKEYHDQCVKNAIYDKHYMIVILFWELCTTNDYDKYHRMKIYNEEVCSNPEHWEIMVEKFPWFFGNKRSEIINEIRQTKPLIWQFCNKYEKHVYQCFLKNDELYQKALKWYMEKLWIKVEEYDNKDKLK